MNPTQYSAVNSQQIAQGKDIQLIGNSAEVSINIGNSFAERREIIEKIHAVASALLYEEGPDKEKAWEARKLIEKVENEITDEPHPDPSRVKRYLQKASDIFKTAAFAKGAFDAFKELIHLMGL